jgi:hypothetical protein
MYYKVGDKTFINKFLAAEYAVKNNQSLHFNMYEDAFDRHNWLVEPILSWDQLLDIRANQIVAKNKPIVLNFSGGTDSYTIYKVFERNNLHIDYIYMRTKSDPIEHARSKQVFDLINGGLYDRTTKIIFRPDTEESYNSAYSSPDWILNKGIRTQFSILAGDAESDDYVSKLIGTDEFVSIIGLEKPRLHFDATGVYSWQDDDNYCRVMGSNTMECFYLSPELPELHIKQSYMLLKYIQSLKPTARSTLDLVEFNDFHNPHKFDWLTYSISGCGRFGDLNKSTWQHMANYGSRFDIHALSYSGRSSDWFKSLSGTSAVKNYIDGIMSIANDTTGKFLMRDLNNFYSLKHFRSKFYKLSLNQ